MQQPHRSRAATATIPVFLGLALVLALWLLARPYHGLRHDSILYMAQVLLQLHPAVFSKDLFFAYGSQNQYSVFADLVARLYVALGLATTQLLLLSVCLTAFVLCVGRLLRELPHALDRWLGLVSLAVMSHLFGGFGIFAFAESFVTARTLAEPLVLAALGALLAARLWAAAVLAALACAVHPLVSLPALVVGWVYLCLDDRRWLYAVPLAGIPVVLALSGVAPFNGLLKTYDADWWAMISVVSPHAFLTFWMSPDWQIVVFDFLLLWLVRRSLPRPIAQLCLALVMAGGLLLLTTAVSADLFRNVLLSSLQTWRVLWLLHLFSLLLLPCLLLGLWRGGTPNQRLAACAAGLAAVATNGRWDAGWAFMAWSVAAWWMANRQIPLRRSVFLAAFAGTCAAVVVLSVAIALRHLRATELAGFPVDAATVALIVLSLPSFALPLAALLLQGWRRGVASRWASGLVTTALLVFGVASWDRRTDWIRQVESAVHVEHPFSRLMPATAQVYWPDNVAATWMLLKRASYISNEQGAGIMFNRETSVEFARRRRAVVLMSMHDQVCRLVSALGNETTAPECPPKPELVSDICRTSERLDYVVLKYPLTEGQVARWRFESSTRSVDYYLYDCSLLRP